MKRGRLLSPLRDSSFRRNPKVRTAEEKCREKVARGFVRLPLRGE